MRECGLWALLSCALLGCSLRSLDDLPAPANAAPGAICGDEMQQITFADGSRFCIDQLETTRAEFDAFLNSPAPAQPMLAQTLALCSASGNPAPGGGADCSSAYQPGLDPELPMTCVTMCEAEAYCQYRGKRLCAGRGGDVLYVPSVAAADIPDRDEWLRACTGEGWQYPYGRSFEAGVCNVGSSGLLPAGSASGCATSLGTLDLSGNVSEWTRVCHRSRTGETRCLVRGGEFLTRDPAMAKCLLGTLRTAEVDPPLSRPPSERSPGVGIRCCHD